MNINTIQAVYFIGAGGIGMSALVRYFLSKGKKVGGYDRTPSELTEKLIAEGADIHYEESVSLIPEAFLHPETTRAFLANPHVDALTEKFGTTCVAGMKNAVLGMDDRTVELQQQFNALVSRYQQIYGGALVELDGKQLTIPQLGPYKEDLDPAVRRAAYEAEAGYFDAHRAELDELYGEIVKNLNAQAPSSFPSVNIPRYRSAPHGNAGMKPRPCSGTALTRRNTGRPRGHPPPTLHSNPWLWNGTSGKPFTVKTAIAPS